MICDLWGEIIERLAKVYDTPFAKTLLTLGNAAKGWHVCMNNSPETVDGLDTFACSIQWNGFPAGIVSPHGGVLAAGDYANEDTFREWLKEASK